MPYPGQRLSGRTFVWAGGALFVGSLTYCAYAYAFRWAQPAEPAWNVEHVLWNTLLFTAFAAHHSLFARSHVKAWIGRLVPDHLNRSVYVWTASALLIAVIALWRPSGGTLYRLSGPAMWTATGLQLIGVWLIAQAVSAIAPLELAGIRPPRTKDALTITGPYRMVRHPLYLGWMLIVFGAAHMTADRLIFAAITATYLVVAIRWEERTLEQAFGSDYQRYCRVVRWRVIPFIY
jgi:protein-S-isoprenylcysteine O-methyltransferase Ste14